MARRPLLIPLLVASAVLCALMWAEWFFSRDSWFGVPYPLVISVALAINVVVTARRWRFKRTLVAGFQRFVMNPPVRILVRLGVPLGWSLLETTGRRTGQPRRVPVGSGLVGNQFWIIAEHGRRAGYVRNIDADPRVRVCLRHGWSMQWRSGIAYVLDDDDPYARQRRLVGWLHPLRALNAMVVRTLGTDLVTVRIDLSPSADHGSRLPARARTAGAVMLDQRGDQL